MQWSPLTSGPLQPQPPTSRTCYEWTQAQLRAPRILLFRIAVPNAFTFTFAATRYSTVLSCPRTTTEDCSRAHE